jgi:hypothetical protein
VARPKLAFPFFLIMYRETKVGLSEMVRVHIFSVVRSGSAINEAMASPGVTNVSSVMFFRTRLERVSDLDIASQGHIKADLQR